MSVNRFDAPAHRPVAIRLCDVCVLVDDLALWSELVPGRVERRGSCSRGHSFFSTPSQLWTRLAASVLARAAVQESEVWAKRSARGASKCLARPGQCVRLRRGFSPPLRRARCVPQSETRPALLPAPRAARSYRRSELRLVLWETRPGGQQRGWDMAARPASRGLCGQASPQTACTASQTQRLGGCSSLRPQRPLRTRTQYAAAPAALDSLRGWQRAPRQARRLPLSPGLGPLTCPI